MTFEKYIRPQVIIEAVRFTGQDLYCVEKNWDNDPCTPDKTTVMTSRGMVPVKKGDYILRSSATGLHTVLDKEEFERTYFKEVK